MIEAFSTLVSLCGSNADVPLCLARTTEMHFACFECRKAFEYWRWGVDGRRRTLTTSNNSNCAAGRSSVQRLCRTRWLTWASTSRLRRMNDADSWEIDACSFTIMVLDFSSCGCGVGFVPPRTSVAIVPEWIERHRQRNEADEVCSIGISNSSNRSDDSCR